MVEIMIKMIKFKKRNIKWFRTDDLSEKKNFEKYKVILPKANGSGAFGEMLSTSLIGYSEIFNGIGTFDKDLKYKMQ